MEHLNYDSWYLYRCYCISNLNATIGSVGQESTDEVKNTVHQTHDASSHVGIMFSVSVAHSNDQINGTGQEQNGSYAVVDKFL